MTRVQATPETSSAGGPSSASRPTKIAAAPEAPVEGLLVQRMERSLFPIELYAGMELDPTFGPVLLVGHAALAEGAGGLAYLQPPLDSTLAHAMLDETDIGRIELAVRPLAQ